MNAHKTLGLISGATVAEIKRAYRRLAQKYHPDKNKEPGAEKQFILIKEAFVFLTTGKSNSGIFKELKPTPKPKPKPKPEPSHTQQSGYSSKHVDKIEVPVTFTEAFTGAFVKVPNTPFTLRVKPGVQSGVLERQLLRTAAGFEAYIDIVYKLYDPIGFYKIQEYDGAYRFCCHLEMTTGQLLSEFTHTLKSVNPADGPILVKIDNDGNSAVCIKGAGIKMPNGSRCDLYVIPVVRYTPLDKEIQPVLMALNVRVQAALKAYNYFK